MNKIKNVQKPTEFPLEEPQLYFKGKVVRRD